MFDMKKLFFVCYIFESLKMFVWKVFNMQMAKNVLIVLRNAPLVMKLRGAIQLIKQLVINAQIIFIRLMDLFAILVVMNAYLVKKNLFHVVQKIEFAKVKFRSFLSFFCFVIF
jgi:hypothetical protein